MTSRKSSRHWLLRDIRALCALLVSVVFVVAILTYSIDWSTFRREPVRQPKTESVEQRYSGSVIVPTGGGLCWTYILDNRTGSLRDGGYSKCDAAIQSDDKQSSQSMDMIRLRDVSKTFRHERE